MWQQIILGVVGGAAYSLSGLAKKSDRESFDLLKMAPTIAIGLVVGGIAGFTNVDYGIAADTALATGITAFIENIWKGIYRKIIKK